MNPTFEYKIDAVRYAKDESRYNQRTFFVNKFGPGHFEVSKRAVLRKGGQHVTACERGRDLYAR